MHATAPAAVAWAADAAGEDGVSARRLRVEETVSAHKRQVLDAGAGAHAQVIKKKNKKQKTTRIGMKNKNLEEKFKEHAQWASSNLDVLRSRKGCCFKEKLRRRHSAEENRIYQWLQCHADDLVPGSLLASKLAIVDALVTKSVAGKKK